MNRDRESGSAQGEQCNRSETFAKPKPLLYSYATSTPFGIKTNVQ